MKRREHGTGNRTPVAFDVDDAQRTIDRSQTGAAHNVPTWRLAVAPCVQALVRGFRPACIEA